MDIFKISVEISEISMEIVDFGNFHGYYGNFIHIHIEPKFYIDPFKKRKYRENIEEISDILNLA